MTASGSHSAIPPLRHTAIPPYRHTAIRRWIVADPTQWKTITQFPTPALRDIAYTAALSTIDLEKEFHQIKWIANQIIDPDLKSIAIRVIDERQDPDTDPDDPFANDTPDTDPFSDTR